MNLEELIKGFRQALDEDELLQWGDFGWLYSEAKETIAERFAWMVWDAGWREIPSGEELNDILDSLLGGCHGVGDELREFLLVKDEEVK